MFDAWTRQDNSPLFRLATERSQLVAEVSRRAFNDFVRASRDARGAGIEYVLNDAAYQEIARMQQERGGEEEVRSIAWWRTMSRRLATMPEPKKREILWKLVESYADDLAGRFNPLVYKMATGALPIGLSFLFKAQDLPRVATVPTRMGELRETLSHVRDLTQRVVLQGDVATLRVLAKKGTLVFVPTHSSNMDSILVRWALYEAGLPPVTYG